MFIGGGGGGSGFYQATIMSTYVRNHHGNAGIPPYALAQLPFPADFDFHGIQPEEFRRFAIAYGLSIPIGEFSEFHLPSKVEEFDSTP